MNRQCKEESLPSRQRGGKEPAAPGQTFFLSDNLNISSLDPAPEDFHQDIFEEYP